MKRREFIAVLGGAVAWPLMARAQHLPMPMVGFLNPGSAETFADRLRGFRQGLKETGYIESENVAILYRWAENQPNRLPELADELVRRKVSAIVAFVSAAPVAKTMNTTIPVVFLTAEDPVKLGLVASLARPGGNLTGVNMLSGELAAKRLELLRELLPRASKISLLHYPAAANADSTLKDLEAAARNLGLQMQVVNASTNGQIDAAFASFVSERTDALLIGSNDPFFSSRRVQLAMLSAHHAIPMISGTREIAEVGGLMSYGPNFADAWHQIGIYTGRILEGTKPAELPVLQTSKFELVINAQTARMLRLTVPSSLLAVADEVIE
jgi:putative tryptophan/tyrosine transport system substrate-binding protein